MKEALESIAARQGYAMTLDDPTSGIFLPAHIPVVPVLEAGQHRRAALIQLIEDQTRAAKSVDGKAQGVREAVDEVREIWILSTTRAKTDTYILGPPVACRCLHT